MRRKIKYIGNKEAKPKQKEKNPNKEGKGIIVDSDSSADEGVDDLETLAINYLSDEPKQANKSNKDAKSVNASSHEEQVARSSNASSRGGFKRRKRYEEDSN